MSNRTNMAPQGNGLIHGDNGVTAATAANGSQNQAHVRFELTDLGNAKRLVYYAGHLMRYVSDMGIWYFWADQRWMKDNQGVVERIAKQVPAKITWEARFARSDEERARYDKWAIQSQQKARIDAMIALARSEAEVVVLASELDADPMLLNVRNGTLNLDTGELRPHEQKDLITKLAPVDFDAGAKCPTWDEFLNRIMDGDTEKIATLQQLVGVSLTGMYFPAVTICYGTGANGKTTFLEAIMDLLGDYSQKAPRGMLDAKPSTAIPNDIARLKGARFVVFTELAANKVMDEALIKDLTGGDTITARYLHKEFFEFQPTHTLWLYGNHKPTISHSDNGIWRRIVLIPFAVTIPPEERRASLKRDLLQELPGILNWAIQGIMDAKDNGYRVKQASSVKSATKEYRMESDHVDRFLAEICEMKESYQVAVGDLYMEYRRWCRQNDEQQLSKAGFGKNLKARGGIHQRRSGNKRYWVGLRLAAPRVADDFGVSDDFDDFDGLVESTALLPPNRPPDFSGGIAFRNDQGEWETFPSEE